MAFSEKIDISTANQNGNLPYIGWVKWAAVCLFLGRAWQHLRWDGPYRALFWDEAFMKPIITGWLGKSWSDYVTDPATDFYIQMYTRGVGVCLVLSAVAILLYAGMPRLSQWIIGLGTALLLFLTLVETKAHFIQAGLFLEYSLQWFTPIIFLLGIRLGQWKRPTLWLAMLACSLTFIGHGLYALGWYPRPGYFVQMTLTITGMSEVNCIRFLQIAGILDLIVAAGLLIPVRSIRLTSAAYMAIWGLLTAMARLVAHFVPAFWQNSLDQWLHEVIFRMPHSLIPMFVFLVYHKGIRV